MKLSTSYVNFMIAQYIIEPIKELDEWVKKYKKCLSLETMDNLEYVFCRNRIRNAFTKYNTVMAKVIHKYKIHKTDLDYWECICSNPSSWAKKIIYNNYDIINHVGWYYICKNPSKWAGKMIYSNFNRINWMGLCENPSRWARKIIKNNPDKIVWIGLSRNTTNFAKRIIYNNLDKINWISLCENKSIWAYEIIKNNKNIKNDLDRYDRCSIRKKLNNSSIEFLENNPFEIDWDSISSDCAKKLFKKKSFTIYWYGFSKNPNIFVPNIQKTNKYYKLFDKLLYKKLI